MRLIFAHDHIFYKYKNQYYSTGGLSKEMLERYTNIFEEVIVISRQKQLNNYDKRLTLASTERVRFIEITNFTSAKNSYKIFEARKLIKQVIAESDAVIARLPSFIGSLAAIFAKKFKKRYLVEVVACPWDAFWNHSLQGKLLAPFEFFKMKKLVSDAPYSIYVTNNFLQNRYPTKGKSVNCSNVALEEFDDIILDNRLNRIANMDQNSKVIIGTIAALDVKYKGQQYIIEALGKLKKQGIAKYEYHLVGGGKQSYLKAIAEAHGVEEQIKFLGTMPHSQVFKWLDRIDLYVQPSRQEGLPRALIEAMSRALPAFGADTAGIPELLNQEFIFSNTKNNINEISSILKSFTMETISKQAQKNFIEAKKYDKEKIEERRKNFLESFKGSGRVK